MTTSHERQRLEGTIKTLQAFSPAKMDFFAREMAKEYYLEPRDWHATLARGERICALEPNYYLLLVDGALIVVHKTDPGLCFCVNPQSVIKFSAWSPTHYFFIEAVNRKVLAEIGGTTATVFDELGIKIGFYYDVEAKCWRDAGSNVAASTPIPLNQQRRRTA